MGSVFETADNAWRGGGGGACVRGDARRVLLGTGERRERGSCGCERKGGCKNKGLGTEGLLTGYRVSVQQSIHVNAHPFQNILTAAQQHQVHDSTLVLQVNARAFIRVLSTQCARKLAAISGASPVLNRLGEI